MAQALKYYEDATTGFPVAPRGPLSPGDSQQVGLVARMRSLRASWDGVARALGRSVHDTRMAFDPGYVPEPMLLREPPEPKGRAAEVVRFPHGSAGGQRSSVLVKPQTREARIMATLLEGPASTAQVAVRCGWTQRNAESGLYALTVKEVVALGAAGWRLTETGRAEAERLAGPA